MKIKIIISFVLISFIYSSINAQVFFSGRSRTLGQIDLAECSVSYLPLMKRRPNQPENYPDTYTDIAIHPNGKLFGISVTGNLNGSFLVEIDLFDDVNKDTLISFGSEDSPLISSLVIDSSGLFYFGYSSIRVYDPKLNTLRNIGSLPGLDRLQGDLAFFNDKLYGSAVSENRVVLYEINQTFTELSEEIFEYPKNTLGVLGLTNSFHPESNKKELLLTHSLNTDFDSIKYLNFEENQLVDLCGSIIPNEVSFRGLTSEDEFRTNFSLRLDLDKDNSRGRLIDHFIIDSLCTVRFPIADQDAWVQSKLGPVDSIRFTVAEGLLHPGEEVLFAEANPAFTIQGQGTDRLVAVNTGGATDAEVAEFIRQVRFEIIADDPQSGEREIHTQLFAAGQASDIARSFFPVDTDKELYAGEDVSVEICDGRGIRLFQEIPNAPEGGRWSPELFRYNEFTPSEDEEGIYRYIMEEGGCQADTALVTVDVIDAPPLNIYGQTRQEFWPPRFYCAGDTAVWDISDRIGDLDYTWGSGLEGPVQKFTQAGNYLLSVYDESTNCRFDYRADIFFSDNSSNFTEQTEACYGDTLEWVGGDYVVFQDTTICVVNSSIGDCEAVNCLEVDVVGDATANRQEFGICQGEAYNFFGQALTESGIYSHSIPRSFQCDSLIVLDFTVHPNYNIFVDTTLLPGQSLQIAGQSFSEPGAYTIPLTTAAGCDSVYQVSLDFTTSTTPVSEPDIWAHNLLQVRQDVYQLRSRTSSSIQIKQLRIVDMLGRITFQTANTPADDRIARWRPVSAGTYWCHAVVEIDGRKTVFRQKIVVVE